MTADVRVPARRAVVVVASNRASAGVYPDRTGPIIVGWLRERGFQTPDPVVVPDGSPVRDAVATAVADTVEVVLTTGGTGISSNYREVGRWTITGSQEPDAPTKP